MLIESFFHLFLSFPPFQAWISSTAHQLADELWEPQQFMTVNQRKTFAAKLKACGVKQLHTVNVLEDEAIRQGVKAYANWPTIPQLYVNGEFVGGSDIMMEMYQTGELQQLLSSAH